jgi:hypothetical protein
MPVHDLPANTQTDSRTALFSCKKRNKYLIHRFRHNAVSVVGDRNHRNTFTPERIHPDFGIRTFLACLDCIFQQVYQHLFNHGTIRINTQVYRPDRDAKTKLQSYAWPGNVRELQHAIERAVILSDGPMLRPENFMLHPAPAQKKGEPEELNLGVLEKEAIERALRRADGNITRAAELLGITRFALYRKLDKLGL